jgi:hypothetical protein
VAIFRAAIVSSLGNGESTYFWTDNWLDASSIWTSAPVVFIAVLARRRKVVMVDALHGKVWVCHITIPLTVQLLIEFVVLWERLEQEVQLMPMCRTH